ncbi:MAG: hypothetical protein LKJ03_02420 [Enterococcaceae bacterium]|nr:hypothetical protein [Enterococcaceae bacterium]MCI1918636.1 hypothetical protein [Enterococcaceae bacterium]
MGVEDRDFIMRQIRQLAEGIGQFLDRKSVTEIIRQEQKESDLLNDEEIDNLLLVADVEQKAARMKLSEEDLAKTLSLSSADWKALNSYQRFPNSTERTTLEKFLNEN